MYLISVSCSAVNAADNKQRDSNMNAMKIVINQ